MIGHAMSTLDTTQMSSTIEKTSSNGDAALDSVSGAWLAIALILSSALIILSSINNFRISIQHDRTIIANSKNMNIKHVHTNSNQLQYTNNNIESDYEDSRSAYLHGGGYDLYNHNNSMYSNDTFISHKKPSRDEMSTQSGIRTSHKTHQFGDVSAGNTSVSATTQNSSINPPKDIPFVKMTRESGIFSILMLYPKKMLQDLSEIALVMQIMIV